jgi:hypothetical protein
MSETTRNAAVAGQNDPLVLRFLNVKREAQGDAWADKTVCFKRDDGLYELELPCDQGRSKKNVGPVSKFELQQLTKDLLPMLDDTITYSLCHICKRQVCDMRSEVVSTVSICANLIDA